MIKTEVKYSINQPVRWETFKGIGFFDNQTEEITADVYTTADEDLATFYTYDSKNRLVGVNSDSVIASYTYDASGHRNSKTVNGETTKHIWDGSDIVADTTSSNALITKYYRGINPVAMVTKSSGVLTPYYYHYDERGSITKLTDKSGTLAQSYTYDAFGNLSTDDDALYNPIRYTGQYTDSETGLVYLRNRYYDPSIGRFTQEDTYWNVYNMIYGDKQYEDGEIRIPDYSAIAQSGNLYVYCMNDPVNGVDPWGMYDRQAAVNYAQAYGGAGLFGGRNDEYYSYRTDCANFVSQCLFAGGIVKNSQWFSYRYFKEGKDSASWGIRNNDRYDWWVSEPWRLAKDQFEFFSNPYNGYINGDVLTIWTSEGIKDVARCGVKPGDLIYWSGSDGSNPHHAAIVTKVENGEIYYSAHTSERVNEPYPNI